MSGTKIVQKKINNAKIWTTWKNHILPLIYWYDIIIYEHWEYITSIVEYNFAPFNKAPFTPFDGRISPVKKQSIIGSKFWGPDTWMWIRSASNISSFHLCHFIQMHANKELFFSRSLRFLMRPTKWSKFPFVI
jgi:hypothetical protein